jgi:hypothetical protein
MANKIPIAEATLGSASTFLLPPEQGDVLVNGMLQESGAIALAGDSRATGSVKTQFGIWLGQPTAGPVGEGAPKPVTGAEFGQARDERQEVRDDRPVHGRDDRGRQGGDLNVLVDSGVRAAIADVDRRPRNRQGLGRQHHGPSSTMLRSTTQTVEYDGSKPDGLELAVSAAMGKSWRPTATATWGDMGALLGFGFGQRCVTPAPPPTPPHGSTAPAGRPALRHPAVLLDQPEQRYADAAAATKILGFVVVPLEHPRAHPQGRDASRPPPRPRSTTALPTASCSRRT